jgi:hypothetical protein
MPPSLLGQRGGRCRVVLDRQDRAHSHRYLQGSAHGLPIATVHRSPDLDLQRIGIPAIMNFIGRDH